MPVARAALASCRRGLSCGRRRPGGQDAQRSSRSERAVRSSGAARPSWCSRGPELGAGDRIRTAPEGHVCPQLYLPISPKRETHTGARPA